MVQISYSSTGEKYYTPTGELANCSDIQCLVCTHHLMADDFSTTVHPDWTLNRCLETDSTDTDLLSINSGKLKCQPTSDDGSISFYRSIPWENFDDYDCISMCVDVDWDYYLGVSAITSIIIGFLNGPAWRANPLFPINNMGRTRFSSYGCLETDNFDGVSNYDPENQDPINMSIRMQRIGAQPSGDDFRVCYAVDGVDLYSEVEEYPAMGGTTGIAFRAVGVGTQSNSWVTFDNLEVRVDPPPQEPVYATSSFAKRGLPGGLKGMVSFFEADREIGTFPTDLEDG